LLYFTFLVQERATLELLGAVIVLLHCYPLLREDTIHFGPVLGRQWHELADQVMADPQYDSYNPNFLNLFRMSKPAFVSLVLKIAATPEYHGLYPPTPRGAGRPPLPLPLMIMICLYRLGHTTDVDSVAMMFGVSAGAVVTYFEKFINTAYDRLLPELIKWPNAEQRAIQAHLFSQNKYNDGRIPGVFGVIDGSHIQLDPHLIGSDVANGYFNRKQSWSMLLQGVVNHAGEFIDVLTGCPGSTHDSRMHRCSDIFCNPQKYFSPGHYLLGDSAYVLSYELLRVYDERLVLTPSQTAFNRCICSMRIIVELAFGRLKARWAFLTNLKIADLALCAKVIAVSCALHNHPMDRSPSLPLKRRSSQ
jgi:hypothetical protein